ncbi:MAG TPA: PQQ-binding-like beta-propeller repeat protein [Streptosporangiaceae bacterium]|jgi:outer membrane protein assembly factor BamB|nr:PQQ-binding-like beta-propeller repeat protein [Streptosporangiaceae bacterium]
MFISILSKRALVTAVSAALLGTFAVAGAAGAAPRPAVSGHPVNAAAHRANLAAQRASTTFSDWPMFRADATHSGLSPETDISTTTAPSLAAGWTATLGTSSYTSPAVATVGGQPMVFAGANSKFYAYPAAGGTAVWSFKTGTGGGAIETSPAVFNGVVYIASTVGTVYALNASTGAVMCSYKTGQLIQASPVVENASDGSGPVVYLGTDPGTPGYEYAIYGPGNTHGSCTVDWQFSAFQVSPGGSWSSPAYGTDSNGTPLLVFGSVDPDDSVYALNADTGARVWRYQTSTKSYQDVGSPPTISAPGQNGFAGGVVYAVGKNHSVYAINLTTGKLIWHYKLVVATNSDVSGTSLVGSTLYLGSDSGVYALNAKTGALIWHVLSGSTFYASPAVTGPPGQQVLIIGDNGGHMYALNLADGSTLWTQRPSTGFWASPAVSQGKIFDIGLDGVLRTFAPPGF